MVSEDIKLTTLNDHYKETNTIISKSVASRDKYFFLVILVLAVMAFQLFSPEQSASIINDFIKDQVKSDSPLNITFLSSIIWFCLLSTAIRYFQITISLEKQYNYVHKLEDQLASYFSDKVFTREGKDYLTNYPKFSEWLHLLYRYVFPGMLVAGCSVKLYEESGSVQHVSLAFIFNVGIYLMITISTCLYVFSLHKTHKDIA